MPSEFGPEFQAAAQEDLRCFEELLGDFYAIDTLRSMAAPLTIGVASDDNLERLSDRQYSIMRTNGSYSLNTDDYSEFESDLSFLDENKLVQLEPIARKMFIGLGVAGTAIREIWGMKGVSMFKRGRHKEAVTDFLASKDDIQSMVSTIFSDEGFAERGAMADEVSDERSMSINGLRLRLRTLFDASGVQEYIGLDYSELIDGARSGIKKLYGRDGGFYEDLLFIALGQPPQQGDKLFFNAISDFTLAAATPIRPEAASHLLARPWSVD